MFYVLFHSRFAIISMGEEKAGCFTLFVFLVSRDCCVALPHDATGLLLYFLIILTNYF